MSVQRFRSFEEAERALWLPPGDPSILKSMKAVWQLSRVSLLVPPQRGIRKLRSLLEANADRDAWEQQRIAAARARIVRGASPPE